MVQITAFQVSIVALGCLVYLASLVTFWTIESTTPVADAKEVSALALGFDIFFAVSTPTALNSLFIVFTFNRAIIRQYHSRISVILMAAAAVTALAPIIFGTELNSLFIAPYLLVGYSAAYFLPGYVFHKFQGAKPGFMSIKEFSSFSDRTAWSDAFLAAIVILFVGVLGVLVFPSLKLLLPAAMIFFEAVVLSFTNKKMGK